MKKGFIVFMAFAMILSYGAVFVGSANAATDGDLIKMDGNSAVYYLNGGKRYVFPNQKTFMTWYPNFDGVVTVSQSEMEGYPLGGNVTYRPGTRLVKITTVPTVYAVEPGGVLRSIVSEANAEALYGSAWNTMIDDVPDSFFVNYTIGSDLTPGMYPTGTLVKEEGSATTYYVDGSTKRPIATGEAFDANMFNWAYLVTGSVSGLTDGTSITAAESELITVSGSGGGAAAAGSVDVALASSTAAATTIISDTADSSQALIPFVTVNFTAPTSGDVTVTNLKFKRTGISADGDINNTYLYDGMTRLAEGGSVSSGIVTFNDPNGLFTVPAGTTKAVTFKIDLTYNTSAGKTMAFELTEVTTSNSATVNGSLPIMGNTMTTASVTDLGNVTITNGTTPASDTTVDPGETDYEVYKITLGANDQDMQLEYLKLTLVGSIDVEDLTNINLTKSGTVLASGVIDENRELVFDLSASPYAIEKGETLTFSVRADIAGGSTRTFKFSTEYSSDLVLKDTNYNVYITPFGSSAWTAKKAGSGTEFTVNSGSLAVSLDTTSPTENVSAGSTNVKLATYKFEATGEDVKVSNLDVNVNTTGTNNGLNNGKIMLDGVQVGTTKDLDEATDVNFTFGSSFIIPAGESKLVDIYADVKDVDSNDLADNDTITVTLGAGSDNAQGTSSLTSISAPSSDTAATALTVTAGTLSLIKYQAYGNQNLVKPATQAKVASFVVSAGAYEGVSVDTVNISQATSNVMQNMKLYDGSTQIGSTKTTLTSSSATENVFSISNLDLAANESKVIDVYADIKSNTGANSLALVVDLAGTTAITSTAVTASDTTMQTMTITTGSIASSADGSQPDSTIVIAGTTATMNAVKFTASNEAFTITKLQISEGDANAYDANGKVIIEYTNKAGSTVTKEGYLNASGDVNFTGLDMYVPKDDTAVLTVKAEIPTIASGADSGDAPGLDFVYGASTFSALGESSNTTKTTGPTTVAANNMIVRKTVPTITLASLPTTVLNDGTQTLSKFTVSADAAGDVYFKELNYTYATTTGVDVTDSTIYLYKYSDQSTALNSAASLTKDGSNSLEVVLSDEEVVAAGTSETYVLKGTISGSASDRSFSTNLKSSASAATAGTSTTYDLLKLYETGGFLWSDGSTTPHSSSSADYADCTYVKNLPTDSQTLSK